MRRALPLAAFLLLILAWTGGAERLIDRGPFDRTPVGSEGSFWNEIRSIRAPVPGTPVSPRLAPRILSLWSTDTPRTARARSTWILLPLLAAGVLLVAWPRTGPWPAILGAVAISTTAPVVLGAGSLSAAAPAALVGLAAILVLGRSRRVGAWILAGLLTALLGWIQPALGTAFGCLLLLGAILASGEAGRGRALLAYGSAWLAAALVLGFAIDQSRLLPAPSGIEAYRGHRAGASGIYPRRGDTDEQRWWTSLDYLRNLSRERERRVPVAEADRVFALRALESTARSPLAELRRTMTRTVAAFQGDPLPRDVSAPFLVEQADGPGLRISLWLGRILIPLGLVGLLIARRRVGMAIAAGAASGWVAATLTYAEPESRLLGVLALGTGLAFLIDALRRASVRGRLGTGVAMAAGVLVWGFLPRLGLVPGEGIQSDDYYALGSVYDTEQRGSVAIREYERALRLDPENPYPRLAIAGILARDNVVEEATRELERLREEHPDFLPGLVALTRAYQAQEQWEPAASVFARLIELEPWNPEHWNNLGTMYVQIGFYEQAVLALESAIRLDPNYEVARSNLAGLRAQGLAPGTPAGTDSIRTTQEAILERIRLGDPAGADSLIQDAYRQFGRRTELRFVEGTLRLVQGNGEAAVELFEGIRDQMRGNAIFLNNLGSAYTQAGRYEDARAVLQQALELQPANRRIRLNLEQVQGVIDSLAAARP